MRRLAGVGGGSGAGFDGERVGEFFAAGSGEGGADDGFARGELGIVGQVEFEDVGAGDGVPIAGLLVGGGEIKGPLLQDSAAAAAGEAVKGVEGELDGADTFGGVGELVGDFQMDQEAIEIAGALEAGKRVDTHGGGGEHIHAGAGGLAGGGIPELATGDGKREPHKEQT